MHKSIKVCKNKYAANICSEMEFTSTIVNVNKLKPNKYHLVSSRSRIRDRIK